MKATIHDVAKMAGVSIATVSKVFNGYTDVNEQTKKKIHEIAKQLQYSPNMAARLLSSKKQKTIALILSELNFKRKSTIPMEVLNGVYRFTDQSDFEFVFYGTSTDKQKGKTFLQFCNEHSIDGVVVQGLKITDPYYEEIQQTSIPTVLIDIQIQNANVGFVSIDNRLAAREAVNYLISQKHNAIGMINGGRDALVSMDRERGYRDALTENNLPVNEAYIQYANYDEDISYFMAKDMLLQNKEITAIFCASDLMAIGAMRAVQSMDKRVPEDVSIIGFDDIPIASYVSPTLATVAQDMDKIGYEAAELVAEIIEREGKEGNNQRTILHNLILRESVMKNSEE